MSANEDDEGDNEEDDDVDDDDDVDMDDDDMDDDDMDDDEVDSDDGISNRTSESEAVTSDKVSTFCSCQPCYFYNFLKYIFSSNKAASRYDKASPKTKKFAVY